MFATSLKCMSCGTNHAPSDRVLVCSKCEGVLDIEYDINKVGLDKGSLKERVRSLWRYREMLPITRDDRIVSLGEGMTSLKKISRYGDVIGVNDLTVKLDYLNPTGSFKDRGTTVSVSRLRELNITSAMDDSSGNAGASLAAYCASAGIECTLYVPATIPSEKLIQARAYGARIEKIEGSRTDVALAAQKYWKESEVYYASHNLSPFFLEGMKTIAYEIAESLDWKVPDHIVFPVGGGVLMVGVWKGFIDLMQLGWILNVPRFHCIQSEACMPIVEAFRRGDQQVKPVKESETVAGGIRISDPARGSQVLKALRITDGRAVSVSDEAILKHQRLLGKKEGLFAEPTSCAALAGLETLREAGTIRNHDSVIVPLTGFGLKDTRTALTSMERYGSGLD